MHLTKELIQFSTAQYLRSVYSNVYHASAQHQKGMAVMAHNTLRIWVTECPLYGYWFKRFMRGVHKRVGEEVRSDFALSIRVLHKILGYLEREWHGAPTMEMCREVVDISGDCILLGPGRRGGGQDGYPGIFNVL
jgi:hypothetical protein